MHAIPEAPLLSAVAEISKSLSTIAAIGLEALKEEKKSGQWIQEACKALKLARDSGARTELQVIDAIESLVLTKKATL